MALQIVLWVGSRLLDHGLRCKNEGLLAEDRIHFMRTGKKKLAQRLTDPIMSDLITQDWQSVHNLSRADTEIC